MACEIGSDTDRENQKLLRLIMEGDRNAVDLLFASHMPQLRRAAAWMLPNPHDSEEALQDGLLLAYRKLNQFQGRAKFSTRLYRIVINAAQMKLRSQGSKQTTSIDQESSGKEGVCIARLLVDPRPNPEEEYIAGERSRILAEMLKDLSTTSRTVIDLMDIDGLPRKEVAQMLGISLSALKARHHRARRTIVRKIQEPRAESNAQ